MRLLFWNIEKFANNKIANPSHKRQRGASMNAQQSSAQRMAYITATIAAAAPDVIGIIEVTTGGGAIGTPATGAGPAGAIALLGALNAPMAGVWSMVPPLICSTRESVAILYRNANLVFSGPFVWPGGAGPAVAPGGAAALYGGLFAGLLPAGRNVPAGALQNVGVAEDQCAASVTMNGVAAGPAMGAAVVFPPPQRAPYIVSFAELVAGVFARNLTLIFVHSPANGLAAPPFLTAFGGYWQSTSANAATEVRVIAGDFNVNLMTAPPAYALAVSYMALTGLGAPYTLIFNPVAAPAPVTGFPGYYATHIKRGRNATYWIPPNPPATEAYYPGYGTIGSDLVGNLYAIDNIFVRYGAGVMPPAPNNATILNGVVGSPYNVVAPAPGGAPTGTVVRAIAMAGAAFAAPAAVAPAFSAGRRSAFNGWNNYGRIRSTSDHLALVVDV